MKKIFILLLTLPLFMFGQSSVEQEIKKGIESLALECPIVLDNITTLNTVTYFNKTATYFYSIDKKKAQKEYGNNMTNSEFITGMNELLTNGFCTAPDMEIYKENNITMIWYYSDLLGKYIGQVKLNKNDCK